MSITFQPAMKSLNLVQPEELTWSASCTIKKPNEVNPDFLKWYQKYDYDPSYVFWELGHKPLEYWLNLAKSFGLTVLYEDYPTHKVYTDKINSTYLILYGAEEADLSIELQVSNANAAELCDFLGIEESGKSHPIAFLKRIENAKANKNLNDYTRPNIESDPNDQQGARMISFGLDSNRLHLYLLKLEEICDHCISREKDITWG